MDFLKENKMYIGIGGCILAIIGCFLPFLNSSLGISINYISGNGKILLVTMVISAILIYLKKDKISLISSCVGGIVFLYNAFNVLSSNSISAGIGLILIFIGLVCAIACPFLNDKK